MVLPTPGGINQGAPARSLELDLLRVQEDQAHKGIAREVHPDLQDGTPWMRKKWCLKKKKKENIQGKDPKPLKNTARKGTPIP